MSYTVKKNYIFKDERLNKIDYKNKKVIVVTAHRRENWGKPLENICNAIKDIAENYKEEAYFVYPVHMNPVVRNTVNKILGDIDNVLLLDPLETDEMHNLLAQCYMVMTDSGGLQEEVPSLGKPVLVLRDVTERPEAVEAGTVKLVGTDHEKIYNEAVVLIENEEEYKKMANRVNPYGDGRASERIVKAIKYFFGLSKEKPEEYKGG
jgi:UDP-N-acetylglucosamine 2-epimerase (non-hydrolysing)